MRTINADIDTLGRCLGAVILEQEGEGFLALEEHVRGATRQLGRDPQAKADGDAELQTLLAAQPVAVAEKLIDAFSTYFLLINIAEEHARVRRVEAAPQPRNEGLERALLHLREQGLTAQQARELLASIELGLTFTAHPTEMRRRTVRAHLEAISALVPTLDQPAHVALITAHVEALWNTPRLRARQPTVRDEVNAGLSYLDVIGGVLPRLERELTEGFARVFGAPLAADGRLPLAMYSWMGGDRDGNPNVTPEATRETFEIHALRARKLVRDDLDRAYIYLSQATPAELDDNREPYRQVLRATRASNDVPAALAELAEALPRCMREDSQARSYDAFARPILVRAQTFGAHLVSLDIREHSGLVGVAVGALLGGTPALRGRAYDQFDETAKTQLLREVLAGPVLGASRRADANADAALTNVLEPMRIAAEAIRATGPRAFGHYIISMSEAPSDLLEVLVLAREAGLDVVPVPLFETQGDLARAPQIMRELLAMPEYAEHLRGGEASGESRVQEIMIGYSDSNKDAGFVAANWALQQAQRQLAEVFTEAGVRYRFFHGRGTSIGRGGGPMVRGILAQPAGTIGAGLRITEQGEALSAKYNSPALAHRSLEQALHGLIVAAGTPPRPLDPTWHDAMERAAHASVGAYHALIHDPGFLPFFEAVTPIGEIAKLRIASRPVRRPGAATLANLRAIPWVMSWTQCRAIVPGWYGMAEALATMELSLAQTMYQQWPFFRAMIDNAQMALAKSEMQIFALYRTLAPSDDRLGGRIEAAFAAATRAVEAVTGAALLSGEPTLKRSIELRNPYVEPIHRLQVELLRKARAASAVDADLDRALVLSLHGIAAGMQNTG